MAGSMIIRNDQRPRGCWGLGNGMAHRISFLEIRVVVIGAITVAVTFTACQDYRNAFNPVQLLCPGDFNPAENRCVIQTHSDVDLKGS